MPLLKTLPLSQQSRHILSNISWLGAANLIIKPLWILFMTAACPRLLGVEGYGVMTAAMVLAALAISFSDLGMHQYSLREVARQRHRAGRYFSNFIICRVGLLTISLTIAFLTALLLDYQRTELTAVSFALLYWALQDLTLYSRTFFRAFEVLRMEAISSILEKFVVIAGGLWLLWMTRQVQWTLAGMAAGMALTAVINLVWVGRALAPFRWRLISPAFIWRSLRPMIPLGLAGLLSVLYLRIDAIMIEAMLGEAALGQYGQAFRILEALSLLPAIVVQSVLFPRLSSLFYQQTRHEIDRLLHRSMLGLLLVSTIIAAGIAWLAPWIIRMLVDDPAFTTAASVLRILCWTFPFTCVNNLLYVTFISANQHRYPIAVLCLTALLNAGLNFMIIPRYGITGAAFMTILSEAFIVGAYLLRYRRLITSNLHAELL